MKFDSGKRVYISGCGGMLGKAVYALFSRHCAVRATDLVASESWLEKADIRDHQVMRGEVERFSPDAIINLAALTDLEQCEREPDNAMATNFKAAEFLAILAKEREIPYVCISTAGIFDGLKDYYVDEDVPKPISVYGKSKHLAEQSVLRVAPQALMLRAGWMMGGGPLKDKKFINKIYKQIAGGARELRVVDDKLGTPTYTHDFARGIMHLLENGQRGLFNQVGRGDGSRYDVAVEFVRLLGLTNAVRVSRASSDEFKAEYFAPRPRSERLVNRKLDELGLNVMRDWTVCLAEYSKEYAADLAELGRSSTPA